MAGTGAAAKSTAATKGAGAAKGGGKSITNAIIDAAGKLIGDVAVGFMDAATKRKYNAAKIDVLKSDSRLKQLSNSERLALETKIASAATDTERIKIYQDTLSKLGEKTIESTGNIYIEKIKSQGNSSKTTYLVIGVGVILILGTIYLLKDKS